MKFLLVFVVVTLGWATTAAAEYKGCSSKCPGCNVTPVEMRNTDNATVILGAMFPVHYYSKGTYKLNKPGLLWIEAFLFAIDEINRDPSLLPDNQLGYRVHDSCNDVSVAIESALELTQGFSSASMNATVLKCDCSDQQKQSAVALVGDASSSTATRVAAVLSSIYTTQISYSATSTDLNSKILYPSFLRTIPPDDAQAVMIADLIVYHNWTYVNVVACDDQYGRVGLNELIPRLKQSKVCIAVQAVYDVRNDKGDKNTRKTIKRLKKEKRATVIILWCQRPEALHVLRVAQNMSLANRTWIATEAYGNTKDVFDLDKKIIDGMFGVVPLQFKYTPFVEQLKLLKPTLKARNPWIDEYWSERKCNKTSAGYRCHDRNVSLGDLPLNKHVEVINAVYSIARGLHEYLKQKPARIIHQDLFGYVRKVNFTGKNNLRVAYDKFGNPLVSSYSLTNLDADARKWNIIASWDYQSRAFNFNKNIHISYANKSTTTPQSSCRENCRPSYYGLSFDKSCCWNCTKCTKGWVQPNFGMGFCTLCVGDAEANEQQTHCFVPTKLYIEADSAQGVWLILSMILGSILVALTLVVVYIYRDTPIVKASNKGLTVFQLVSSWFLFLLPLFVLQSKISSARCGAQLCYFMCFNAITISITFIKADRLLRIFNCSKSGRLTSQNIVKTNKVQYFTVGILTTIGLLVCLVPSLLFGITVETTLFTKTSTKHCAGFYDTILFIAIGYLVLISLVCAVYAFKARKLPEGFNEARFTSFTMFFYLLSWLMFIPIYFSTHDMDRDAAWCFVSFFANLAFLLTSYYTKAYYIFYKTEENTPNKFRENIRAFNRGVTGASNEKHSFQTPTFSTVPSSEFTED